VLASCSSGTYLTGSTSAPGEGANGNTMSQASFNDICCAESAKCSSFTCSSGYQSKPSAGSISCPSDAASCTNGGCCDAIPTCLDYSAIWITASLIGGGCSLGNSNNFFDTKKNGDQVASPYGDDEVTAACCTPYSDAVCNDWAPVLASCGSGTYLTGSTSAAGEGANGNTMSQASFNDICCATYETCPVDAGNDDQTSSSSHSRVLAPLIVISLIGAYIH